ncbi:MAG TPA: bifunctional lysylphosphatidylglycerol flippase/synthetase MprF [Longimicrobiales bacterium]|nr:bifunctional lysylphosphatidylglycerol flippase/synthetase MprF [Longimicrobiales bacterium]
MMSKLRKVAGPLIGLLIFLVAVWVLHSALRRYHYRDIVRALHALPDARLLLALLLTAANYLVLTGYDALGLRYIRTPLAYPRIAFASFIAYAFSHNLGFPLLTGAPLRFRLYSAWGLSAVEVTNVIAFNSLTFFLGLFTIGGLVFTLSPLEIPQVLHVPFESVRPVGGIFLAIVAAYLFWGTFERKPIRIRGWEFTFPATRLSLLQMLVSVTDWALAGGVFWAVLPPSAHISYPGALAIFILAQAAGLVTNIPGGLGVFEAVVLVLLEDRAPPDAILGSLLAYRGIYYLLPLASASVLLALHEARQRREDVRRVARVVGRWAPVVAPQLLAFTTFLAGVILLFSAATPAVHSRLRILNDFLPLEVIEASHFLASIAGAGLLLLARGIQRRLDAAFGLTVVVLLAGITLSLLKGADYEEAIALTVLLLALVPARRYFYRRASLTGEPFTIGWIVAIAIVLAGTIWLGFFSYKHVEYSSDLFWRFALRGDAPRFLRASVGAVGLVIFVAASRLLRPAPPEPTLPTAADLARAREVVARSVDTTANLALLGDKALLFSESGRAFIMYAVEGRTWVALGDPVGPDEEWAELLWRFRELVDRHGGWTVFYQVKPQGLPLFLDLGLTLLKLGEEARVRLEAFSLEGGSRKGMRRVRNRLEKEGCTFEVVPVEAVTAILPELRRISDAWLAEKRTREKGFSLGFFDERYIASFPTAVVRCGGRIVAFANVWPGAFNEELSVDLMRYGADAPEDVMEYLFLELMLWGKAQGYRWFSLGMAPLSGLENRALAPLWNRLGALVFRYGENFYSFQGLRQYKEKFGPVWEPKYLAAPGGLNLPRILASVASLISGGIKGVVTR